ncbi:unnamed protein product [Symbiodinium sp. KB8]|nr:unnamed protein product [Symbiodinium sp. KB8]
MCKGFKTAVRDDHCSERYKADCARHEANLGRVRQNLLQLAEEYESQEAEHFDWLFAWHQRLLRSIAAVGEGSSSFGAKGLRCSASSDWQEFKRKAFKVTQDVAETRKAVAEHAEARRITR